VHPRLDVLDDRLESYHNCLFYPKLELGILKLKLCLVFIERKLLVRRGLSFGRRLSRRTLALLRQWVFKLFFLLRLLLALTLLFVLQVGVFLAFSVLVLPVLVVRAFCLFL